MIKIRDIKTTAIDEFDYVTVNNNDLSDLERLSINSLGTQIGEANKIIDSDTIVVEEEIKKGLGTVRKLKAIGGGGGTVTSEITKLSFDKIASISMGEYYKSLLFNVKQDANGDDILYLSNGTNHSSQRLSIRKNLNTEEILNTHMDGFGANTSDANGQVVIGTNKKPYGKISDVKWDNHSNKLFLF